MNKAVTNLKPEAEVAADPLARLRDPFPANQVSKLPKESRAQADQRKADRNSAINCNVCGGWHHKNAVHLDYVGHAALTDRLLDVDPHWSWEPAAFGPDGLPLFDRNGGLWIKLTVCDVTRLGYGNAEGKSGGDAVKEIIGDALRNAAMRFGAALDLWHKGDLHAHEEAESEPAANESTASAADAAIHVLRTFAGTKEKLAETWAKNKDGWKQLLDPPDYARVVAVMKEIAADLTSTKAPPAPPPPPPPRQAAQRQPAMAEADNGFGIGDDEIPF